jgi:hypothetical protein
MSGLQANTLYIVLYYLRTDGTQKKYVSADLGQHTKKNPIRITRIMSQHWGFIQTTAKPANGSQPGRLYHATDAGRQPLDLYPQGADLANPVKSRTMAVCLQVGRVKGGDPFKALDAVTDLAVVPLMDVPKLKLVFSNETQWTCRVWVKAVLSVLRDRNMIDAFPLGGDLGMCPSSFIQKTMQGTDLR